MAEVGVLNLTIQDNSEQAAAGLEKLATALERVKSAVSGGMRLSGVAKHIEQIGNAINSSISEATPDFNTYDTGESVSGDGGV